jgi:hypothetical protein
MVADMYKTGNWFEIASQARYDRSWRLEISWQWPVFGGQWSVTRPG